MNWESIVKNKKIAPHFIEVIEKNINIRDRK